MLTFLNGLLPGGLMKRILLAVLIVAALTPALAEPLSRDKTPEALRPWIEWVLYGHEEERCPFFQGDADQRRCSWPSRLALDLNDHGGRFSQQWILEHDGRVPLPGDAKTWPLEVRVDGRPAVVDAKQGAPGVRLPAGRHGIGGVFEWGSLPPVLQVPTETGLVGLTIRGRAVPFPGRDEQGRLWLQTSPTGGQAEDRLDLTVNRKLTDDIPLVLTTRIGLEISGKSREVVLGRPLPRGSSRCRWRVRCRPGSIPTAGCACRRVRDASTSSWPPGTKAPSRRSSSPPPPAPGRRRRCGSSRRGRTSGSRRWKARRPSIRSRRACPTRGKLCPPT